MRYSVPEGSPAASRRRHGAVGRAEASGDGVKNTKQQAQWIIVQ
jgi:hypothetical protein